MPAEIVSLHGDPIYTGESKESVVKVLEEWLERARSGEIIGVAVAVVYRDGAHGHNIAGSRDSGLIGELFSLAHSALD